jgi:hypothetical protein
MCYRLPHLKTLYLSDGWAFQIFIWSKCCSLLLQQRYFLYVVNYVDYVYFEQLLYTVSPAIFSVTHLMKVVIKISDNLRNILP